MPTLAWRSDQKAGSWRANSAAGVPRVYLWMWLEAGSLVEGKDRHPDDTLSFLFSASHVPKKRIFLSEHKMRFFYLEHKNVKKKSSSVGF